MNTQRILIFSTAYFPIVGGAEVAIQEITERISLYEFDLITPRLRRDLSSFEKIGATNVYRVGIGSSLDKFLIPVLGVFMAFRLHKKHAYKAIWSMMASQASVAASFFSFLSRVPLLLTLQEGDEEEHLHRYVGGNLFLYRLLIRPWYVSVYKRATRITAISTHLKKRAVLIRKDVPIDIIPNGVDVERFGAKIESATLDKIRKGFGFSLESKIICTASRLVKKNAVGDVIRALPLLPPDVCFVICGTGHLHDSLVKLSDELGVSSRVRFLGHKNHDELVEILQASDISIRPSLSEGLGNSFIESMMAGVITIGTPVGGIPDFLKEGMTGFFCEPSNPESISKAVYRALRLSDAEREALRIRAQTCVLERYTWKKVSVQMKQVFDRLCEFS